MHSKKESDGVFPLPQHPAPLEPKMEYLLQQIHKAKTPPFWSLSPEMAKQQYHRFIGVFEKRVDAPVKVVGAQVKCPEVDKVKIVSFKAEHCLAQAPTILFTHGGGYILGSVAGYNNLCRALAHAIQGQVIAIDYKKTPEFPFPHAPEEVFQLMRLLLKQPALFGADPARVYAMGDSAGGTLTIQAIVRCLQEGLSPNASILIYPGTAGYPNSESAKAYQTGYLLEDRLIEWMFQHYLPDGTQADWRFAPLQAPNLEKFPPVFIQLAECDPLVDEGVAFANLLAQKNVRVDLKIYPGVVHGFYQFDRALPSAVQAQQDAVNWLKKNNFI